jgi:negative regulator of flagellin synthesis FlgM
MADKINGYGRVGLDVGATRSRPVTRPAKNEEGVAAARSRETGDAVAITDTAARLKAIEARLASVPDVDRARVEALRQKVESGEYQPDSARIAAKLIRMEQDLS